MAESPDAQSVADDQEDTFMIQDPPILEYFIIKQEVELEVDFRQQRISGKTDIFLVTFSDKVEEFVLDAAQCDIDVDEIVITEMRESDGELVEGQRRKATCLYDDPYDKLGHPKGWDWKAEHHNLRRFRSRYIFHSRKTDIPAENREFEGCTPAYGSLQLKLRAGGAQDRPRLIIRKSASNLDALGKSHKQFKITVPFVTKTPRDGLHFIGVDALDTRYTHMYTRHSLQPGTASCIFPCMDDHGCRCDWKTTIKHPRTLGDALHQALVTQTDNKANDRKLALAEEDKLREMSVICSGFLMEEYVDPEDETKKVAVFEPEKKVSVQKLGFAIGPFEHIDISSEFRTEEDEVKLGMSALKIHAYCLPRRGDWVRQTCAAVTMAADFFTYTFAKYPFENFKICFLDDLAEDTVILHSLAFASNRLLYPEDILDKEIETTRSIIFTLTSQWIGINMIPNTRNDLWLVIGIAHYMTDIFMKKLCGNNEYRFRMKTMADELARIDINRPCLFDLGPILHLGQFEMDFMALKSPVVFFILDKRLSKASGGHGFTRVLQKMLTKAQIEGNDRSTILDTEKFRATCEKASRYRLEGFWKQWIHGSGCPRFDVKAKFNKKRLCVELTLQQVQFQTIKEPQLDKDDFLRVVKERRANVPLGGVQPLFTGPMTVRIHEADGTPYEHILEIREDAMRSTKFEIPYNTKYKRLKRTRKMKEKHSIGASMEITENADDALLYCLGDVLQSADDQREWELIDWDPDTERKMDQESYEWIRLDADFEWACDMKRTLEPYMYVSQLQQDRDVVAQQDAILYLAQGPLHPIASGFLVRTLLDRRYYHGIRTMAARALTRQANIKDIPMLGLRQLMKAFRVMYCYDQTNQPKPNNFSDKKQYIVRCAIIQSIAAVRDHTYRCPLEARRFILDQLRFNNNEDNPFSDHFYIALLVETLAKSMVPSQQDDWLARQSKRPDEEEQQFVEDALEQIERVLRRDEWTNSYQNIWTIAGLDAKQKLMKAEVIPKNFSDFAQYLLDGTRDLIRIKCFEALIDLGAMMDPTFFTFLMYALMTDRSPYVRSKLIGALATGLAAIAFGDHSTPVKHEPLPDESDGLLLVQDSEKEIEARKEKFARKENLEAALNALKREMDETYVANKGFFNSAMSKALDHGDLGRADVDSLLDLASMMFGEAENWVLTLKYPRVWRVKRERPAQQLADRVSFTIVPVSVLISSNTIRQLIMNFRSFYKTKPKRPLAASAPSADVKRPPTVARTSSIKIMTKPASTPKRPSPAPAPASALKDSIVVYPPAPATTTNGVQSNSTPSGSAAKRSRPEKDESASPAPKRPKTETKPGAEGSWKRRRMITLKTANPHRLAVILGKPPTPAPTVRTALPGAAPKASSKDPSPAGSREGSTPKPARKPLPTGAQSGTKPSPSPSPASKPVVVKPPPPIITASPKPTPPPAANGTAGSPPPDTPTSARPKIKIIKRPPPPPSAP